LEDLGIWDDAMRVAITAANGSIQNIARIPDATKAIFKTAFEIKQLKLIQMAAARGVYVDQSQSFNIHIADPDNDKLTTCLFAARKAGLKTWLYYLRSKPAMDAVKYATAEFETEHLKKIVAPQLDKRAVGIAPPLPTPPEIVCSLEDKSCGTSCGS
jgi:ribonucleotide reductase alpha subunit